MDSDWDIIGKEGLQFFGKISASISHEIKNVLAIINENAGLLEDFTLMAEKGRPIDMERFKTVAGKIRGQVGRADGIVKNFNRFNPHPFLPYLFIPSVISTDITVMAHNSRKTDQLIMMENR